MLLIEQLGGPTSNRRTLCMADVLDVDWRQIFEAQAAPNYSAVADPYDAGLFLTFADLDYVLFRGLALADLPRDSLHHLQQAVEKYFKSILLSRNALAGASLKTHRLDALLPTVVQEFPLLGGFGFAQICRMLTPYQQYGHYPEAILDYPRLRAEWNRRSRDGLSEADLIAATLRECAIEAMGRRPDAAWLLETIVHGDAIPFVRNGGAHPPTHAALRSWLLTENQFFTPDTLPTYLQRYTDHLCFPLSALPRQHP